MKGKFIILLVKILGKSPLWLSHKIAVTLGSILYLFPIRENKISKKNIDLVFPKQSQKTKNHLRKKSTIETLKTLLESPKIWQLPPNKVEQLVIHIEGKSLIDQALAENLGVILALPHLGSWELLGFWVSLHYTTTSLYRRSNFPIIDRTIQNARSKNGANLVPNTNKGVITLVRGLKNRHVTCILPDQDPGKSGNVFANFFNIPTRTSTLTPKLSQKTGAKIIMACMIRQKDKRGFTLTFSKPNKRVYDDNLEVSVAALNLSMEQIILKNPEQYMWSYNRFKPT